MSRILMSFAGSLLLAGSLVASAPDQSQATPQATPTPQARITAETGTPVTSQGCLKKWDPKMAGWEGIPNPAKLEFVLTDLAPGTAAAPALPNVLRYLVKAKDATVVLTPHVNHRVEVSGLVTGLSESNPTSNPPVVPTLTVAAVKMISTECI
jgi:hypothetical protein